MRFAILILLAILTLPSCYKDVQNPDKKPVIQLTEVDIEDFETGMIGTINNGTIIPSSDYALEVNNQSYNIATATFFHELRTVNKTGQLLELIQDNKLAGLKYSYLVDSDINMVEFSTIEGFKEQPFLPGSISLDDSAELSVTYDGSFVTKGGQQLNEDITIHTKELIVSNELTEIASSAYLASGELVSLVPEKAIVLALYASGERVFADSKVGTAIDFSSTSGKTLFVYHRTFGYWVEVPQAEAGGFISDQFDHFVIADYVPAIYMEGRLTQNMEPISYAKGSHDLVDRSLSFFTTEKGQWAQVLPQNAEFNASIYNPCNELVHNMPISTEQMNIVDEHIILDQKVQLLEFGAQVIDCEGYASETNSIVVVENEENVSNYMFSNTSNKQKVIVCAPNVKLAATNLESNSTGPLLDWNVNQSENIETLTHCADHNAGYTYLQIRDDVMIYDRPFTTRLTDEGNTELQSHDGSVRITFKGDMAGSYQEDAVNIYLSDREFGKKGYEIDCEKSSEGCGFSSFEVTHSDKQAGGWFRVSFSGILYMQTLKEFTKGDFPVSGVILIKG